MNYPLLGVGNYARTPYYFPKLCIHIWSVEELCYLFKTNPFILDRDIMDKNLVEWLVGECGLTELGHRLHRLFHQVNSVSLFVMAILEYVNYCTPDERQLVKDILQDSVGLKEYEKKKMRADYLVENGKYLTALQEYERILDMIPEGERLVSSRVHHNRGVVFARLFMFERAAENFRTAYELTGKEESGRRYLAAVRQQLSEREYIHFITEHPQFHNLSLQVERLYQEAHSRFEETEENRMLFALKVYKEEGNVASYYEEIENLTTKIKQQYRDNVM